MGNQRNALRPPIVTAKLLLYVSLPLGFRDGHAANTVVRVNPLGEARVRRRPLPDQELAPPDDPFLALAGPIVLVSRRSERSVGNALVAPVIAYVPEGKLSPPSGHMRFPGTISVPEAAFETILEYAARSFKLHGFKDIVFLGDHGGYQANEKNVANKLNREWVSSNVRAHAVTQYYDATQIDFVQILKGQGFTLSEIGTHAGLDDTSLMLALDPSLVREDRLSDGSKFGAADGVYGDPSKASARLGILGVDAIVFQTVASIKSAVSRR